MYIKQITFNSDCRTFKAGTTIDLMYPVIILVGQNGTGKSTLLQAIATKLNMKMPVWSNENLGDCIDMDMGSETAKQNLYFNFHSNDVKNASAFMDDYELQIQTMKASSGVSTALQFVKSGIISAKNSFCIIDEPDRGASPKLQELYKRRIFESCIIGMNQLIVSTHSERIMNLQVEYPELFKLYSVEHQAYMSKEEFLTKHLK